MNNAPKKICVAMSGGVDSSVAAYLLNRDGHTLIGVTMCFGVTDEQGRAARCGPQAAGDAHRVCDQLAIPHYVLDFSQQLHTAVIADFVEQYGRGRTPNPCVRCNRYLKFTALYEYARSCGCDAIATGHYAKIGRWQGRSVLMRHHDAGKDQSYFLWSILAPELEHVVFPLAEFKKSEVRAIAREARLPVAEKPESREICFIPDNDYRGFLRRSGVVETPGPFIDTAGRVLGTHRGIFNYTIGQRKHLGIAVGSPRYVVAIDASRSTVVLGSREELLTRFLTARETNLFVDTLPVPCTAKVRYTQNDVPCEAAAAGTVVTVNFPEPVEAVTPGQSIVLYDNDIVLGGGIIDEACR
ncbi:MAG: tRNA 2-thiouridine(34) synthase MnmA [Chitinispirillaceae bacterium]|nr:tRNA 2-thiouridine(34) synthase MnmA [Chitinispirillaceae bacterium]